MGYSRKNLSINYNDKQCFPLSFTVKMLLRTLVLLLVAGCAYIAGIMTEIKLDPELDTEGRVKSSVEDFLAYPSAANYKNVQYYVLTKSEEGMKLAIIVAKSLVLKMNYPMAIKVYR